MSLNIIDLVKGQLGPALVSQAATKYGESESSIFKGITAFLPILMGKLTGKVENSDIFNTLTESSKSGILGNLLNLNSDDPSISKTLPTLLNENEQSEITDEVAQYANINKETSQSLLIMVTGAILGGVGKHAIDNKLNASELANVLSLEKSKIISMIPSGISAKNFGLKDEVSVDLEKTPKQTQVEEKKSDSSIGGETKNVNQKPTDNGGSSILKWLIPLILVLVAGYLLFKQYNNTKSTETKTTPTESEIIEIKATDSVNANLEKEDSIN